MNLNPDGAATLCCQSWRHLEDEGRRDLNLQTHTMQDIWNGAGIKDLRRRMNAGEELPHCDACFNNERYGRSSYRLQSNKRWLVEHPRAEEIKQAIESSEDGSMSLKPLYFDLRIGNVCNLKCTACKPLYSSQIDRDPAHSRWITDAVYSRYASRFPDSEEWSQSKILLDEIVELSDELCVIQLAGGEPTVNKTQMALLSHLCESGRAKDIDLEVVTNLSNVRDEIYRIFNQFKSLRISLSIDGQGDTYEYVRFPGKWHVLVRNVRRLREICPNVRVAINSVLQAVNAINIVDLLSWAEDEEIPVTVSIGRGLDQYNDFRIIPPSLRAELRRRFDDYCVRKANRRYTAMVRENFLSVLQEMDDTDFTEDQRRERVVNFMQFANDMDKTRRLSLKQAAPEVYHAIAQYHGSWDTRTRFA